MSHVVVLGAGSIGLHAAYHLRARGHDVTVVEPGGPDRDGASFGNAGIVVPSHFVPLAAPGIVGQGLRWLADPTSPFYVAPRPSPALAAWGYRFWRSATSRHVEASAPHLLALNLHARELWTDLAAELGDVAFQARGLLMLCRTEAGLAAEASVAAHARRLGLRAEVLDAAAVRAAEPDIDLDVVGAVRFPDDANMDPRAVMEALQALLEARGVRFRFGTRATRIVRSGGRATGVEVVAADAAAGATATPARERDTADASAHTTLAADHVVLAAGAWSGALARDVGVRLLLEPGKGYGLTIEGPSQALRSAAILVEAKASAARIGDRLRVGGTMELAGFDPRVRARRLDGIKRAIRTYFPSLRPDELDAAEVWHGFRPLSPDGLPYLGAAPSAPNVVIATGHAMMGFSAGPATGRVVADLVGGDDPPFALSPFRVDRHG